MLQTIRRSVWLSLLLSAAPVVFFAVVSSLLVDADSPWYLSLRQPSFNPPSWVFSAAWSIVYLCVIVSLFLLLRSDIPLQSAFPGLGLLALTGMLNVLWTAVFFRLHAILPAAYILYILLGVLTGSAVLLRPLQTASAVLLLPHILWGAFAFLLNIALFYCNLA